MAGKRTATLYLRTGSIVPQRSPAVMAGKSKTLRAKAPTPYLPQRSPAVMAGKRRGGS